MYRVQRIVQRLLKKLYKTRFPRLRIRSGRVMKKAKMNKTTMNKTRLYMDTVVEIIVVVQNSEDRAEAQIKRVFDAFYKVEQACSRFSQESELMRACSKIETWVPISSYIFEPLRFALEIADWSGGLFDPTVGRI